MDMVEVKTSELIGVALDWAVAKAEDKETNLTVGGCVYVLVDGATSIWQSYSPSTDWSQGGPLIEREISKLVVNVGGTYTAQIRHEEDHPLVSHKVLAGWTNASGPKPLIAAMRCIVKAKLGDTVQVPAVLVCT